MKKHEWKKSEALLWTHQCIHCKCYKTNYAFLTEFHSEKYHGYMEPECIERPEQEAEKDEIK